MNSSEGTWQETSQEMHSLWRDVFNSEATTTDLSALCPSCQNKDLHRWFVLESAKPRTVLGVEYSGRGRVWEWCGTCHTFEHYMDGFVPIWWAEPYRVDADELRYDPGPVEAARLRHNMQERQADGAGTDE
ncbi:hypothetical protein [Streptomyces sp. DSM 40907]|uniref:hypothetical protein n=1 Tax=Streptomyces kutzneri TaxID=3051179 RepID=UPI0028D4AFB6|nr:hypothetical protein [Streptomyces sp. DSM 40907]